MSRKVTTDDVASYAHHLPKKEIKLDKKESMVYKKGVLVKGKGKTDLKVFQKVRLQSCREVQNYISHIIAKGLTILVFPCFINNQQCTNAHVLVELQTLPTSPFISKFYTCKYYLLFSALFINLEQ